MKRIVTSAALAVGLGIVLFGPAGCAKKPPAKTAPEVEPVPTQAAPATPVKPPDEFTGSRDTDLKAEELPRDVAEINKRGYLKDVFYDFDKAEVREDQRDVLAKNAEWLRKYGTIKFRLEGHCDERGTREYNLALGERRATAAKDYLASLGIDAARVEVVSYGKERPFSTGHDEDAWAQNRRAHFVVTAK